MSNVLTCDGCGQPITSDQASIGVTVQQRPATGGTPGAPGMPVFVATKQLDFHPEHLPEGLMEHQVEPPVEIPAGETEEPIQE